MLPNLNELMKATIAGFNETVLGAERPLPEAFKKVVSTFNGTSIEYNQHTCRLGGRAGEKNRIYFPTQWFYIAAYMSDYYLALQNYKNRVLDLLQLGNLKDAEKVIKPLLGNRQAAEELFDQKNIHDVDRDYLINFLCDYNWWAGAKTIDRNDFFVSPILSLAKLVNASQGFVADLCKFLAEHPEAKAILQNEIAKPYNTEIREALLLDKNELIAKVRESFMRYWGLIDQSGATIDHYTTQFETTFGKFLLNLGLGIDNVFQIIDFSQYCTITDRLATEYSELAFLKNYKEHHGWRYEVGRAYDLYRNFLEILSFSDFRANIDKQQERNVAVASSALDNSELMYLRAMRTKPFLLLAGISGTGKSRIVKQLAFKSCPDKGNLRKDPTSPGNYCLIEVKPNWHDSTELLGYQSQIKNGYILTPFVKFLAKAMLHPDIPFFVCLDEMNLAPVEQYFAEFLSVLESRKKHGARITSEALIPASIFVAQDLTAELFGSQKSVSNGYGNTTADNEVSYGQESAIYEVLKRDGLRIPDNLIVIGTVNMDETTHQFSRKVIDRAMTIEMNIADGPEPFSSFFEKYEDLGYTETPLLKELFLPKYVSADQAMAEMDTETIEFLKAEVPLRLADLNAALNGTPFKIAYRVQNELVLYFASLLADSPEAKKEDLLAQAIDGILMMKVLPRVEGDEDLLKKPLDKLADFAVTYTASSEKIKEMKERLERGHFTSFWP